MEFEVQPCIDEGGNGSRGSTIAGRCVHQCVVQIEAHGSSHGPE